MANRPSIKLRDAVVSVLRDPAIYEIHFEYKSLLVTNARYSRIADLVAQGMIACSVGVPQSGAPPGSMVVASYVPTTGNQGGFAPNQFLFPSENYGSSSREKDTIVHEATHAIFDVFLKKSVLAIDDEAVCWLAGALFCRFAHLTLGGGLLIGGAREQALELADKLIARKLGGRTYTISLADMQPLRDAVTRDYDFTGGAAGILDIYDGVP